MRVGIAGVSFVVPEGVEATRDGDAATTVRIEVPLPGVDGTVVVEATPVRSANGLVLDELDPVVAAELADLDAALADPRPEDEVEVAWVNGRGRRSSIAPYEFRGLTTDERTVVSVRAPAADPAVVADLDRLVGSIVVDSDEVGDGLGSCVDDLALRENRGVADGEVVEAGSTFEFVWLIENTGSCTWTDRYSWTFTGGDALTIASIEPVPTVAPGDVAEVAASLISPDEPGVYSGQFQLFGPDARTPIGPPVAYLIVIE